ncbi:MAG: hypothetical protein NZ658_04215, partial [Pirellulales bacterium]|nr:hypothetical protein [Pirellulales bacterium]
MQFRPQPPCSAADGGRLFPAWFGRAAWRTIAAGAVLLVAGCGGGGEEPTPKPEPVLTPADPEPPQSAGGEAGNPAEPVEPAAPAEPPFAPPPLEALNRDTTWIDRPVRDALADLAIELAEQPPLATPAEALALKNDSAEHNATILSAVGRLPAEGE